MLLGAAFSGECGWLPGQRALSSCVSSAHLTSVHSLTFAPTGGDQPWEEAALTSPAHLRHSVQSRWELVQQHFGGQQNDLSSSPWIGMAEWEIQSPQLSLTSIHPKWWRHSHRYKLYSLENTFKKYFLGSQSGSNNFCVECPGLYSPKEEKVDGWEHDLAIQRLSL